jgi:hypothetical protein
MLGKRTKSVIFLFVASVKYTFLACTAICLLSCGFCKRQVVHWKAEDFFVFPFFVVFVNFEQFFSRQMGTCVQNLKKMLHDSN